MDTILQDIRYAARKLIQAPAFSLVAIGTLAVAIGASTAIFSVVNSVVLRPLPFREPERLVRVMNVRQGQKYFYASPLDFLDWRKGTHSFDGISAYTVEPGNLTGSGDPERISAALVSDNFFSVVGASPARGRGFARGEEERGAQRVVVLSDAFWRRRFNADPASVGQSLTLDGHPFVIVGIAPRDFRFPEKPDVWVPLRFSPDDLDESARGSHYLNVIGRLKAGVTAESATQDMVAVTRILAEQYPGPNALMSGTVAPLQEFMVGDADKALYAMLGAVGFVLLIACANVANLLLVRAAGREAEMAVRGALGAGRWRIARQLITESLLLSGIGGALGAIIASWSIELVRAAAGDSVPRLDEVSLDTTMLLFTAAVAVATGLVFGLLPAVRAARADIGGVLKGGRGADGRRASGRLRAVLVVSEMALAVILLVGAGLLIRSFELLTSVDPGFRPEHVVTFSVSAPDAKYSKASQLRALMSSSLEHMRAVPGAQSAGLIFGLPLTDAFARTSVHIDGTPPDPPEATKATYIHIASADYFRTMGIGLIRGRTFSAQDRGGAPMVAVVNQEFVRRYIGGGNPIGQHVTIGWTQDTSDTKGDTAHLGGEIIGVVADVRAGGLGKAAFPQLYASADQAPVGIFSVVVRSTADPDAVAAAMRRQMRSVDPDLPIYDLREASDLVAGSVARPRFYVQLLGAFAAIALLLAVVGIYGVISYTVTQRTRELGIRMALGASGGALLTQVLGQGMSLTVSGIALGVLLAQWLTKSLQSLLFGVAPLDLETFVLGSLLLAAASGLACVIPARRAARVDPAVAMRNE